MDTKKRQGRAHRMDTIREERRRQRRRQRLATILTIGGVVVVVIAVILIVSLRKMFGPIGQIIEITPVPRPMASDNSMGDPKAPVKIVEYSDFQCPICLEYYQQAEPQIVNEYIATGKVYFTYRSMGNWIGAESVAAAQAAYCAGDQNKFWEYHDMLFTNWTGENVGDFNSRRLTAFAQKLGLDMNAFNSCFNGHKYADKVSQDNADGLKAGVQGTPTFFINGTKYDGAPTYAPLKAAIDAALAGK